MTRAHTHGGWRHLPAALIAAGFVLPIVYMVTGSARAAGTSPPRTARHQTRLAGVLRAHARAM